MQVLVETNIKEGFEALLGKTITVFCNTYIYTGVLIGINATCIKLTEAGIVYETGKLLEPGWKDAQKLPGTWYIQLSAVESFGILK